MVTKICLKYSAYSLFGDRTINQNVMKCVLSFLTKTIIYSCFFIPLLHNSDTNAEVVKLGGDERSVNPVYFSALSRPLFPNHGSAEYFEGFRVKS
jgi:hypothetical protein